MKRPKAGPEVGSRRDVDPAERYRHAMLGDAIEPTALMLLERHGLESMASIALPPPHVFEDSAPRPIGIPNRWLSPSTDGRRLLAVVTPHLGGVLHRHEADGDRLPSRVIARGPSNHAIGHRELDISAWIGSHWVVPTPERRRLLVFDLDSAEGTQATRPAELGSPVAELKAWRRGPDTGVAALLQDGSTWWVGVGA